MGGPGPALVMAAYLQKTTVLSHTQVSACDYLFVHQLSFCQDFEGPPPTVEPHHLPADRYKSLACSIIFTNLQIESNIFVII